MSAQTHCSAYPNSGTMKNQRSGNVEQRWLARTVTSHQPSDRVSSHDGKPCASVDETETFLTNSRTTSGDCTSALSPVMKSVTTVDDDAGTTKPRTLFGTSVLVVPSVPNAASVVTVSEESAAHTDATEEVSKAAVKPDVLPSHVEPRMCYPVLPEGVKCCPIPRWNWTRSESSKKPETSSSPAQSHQSGTVDSSVFGVTEANREAVENLSPFKQWEFTRFLVAQSDAAAARLQPQQCIKPTLVLDLDETLVHTSTEVMSDADAVVTVKVPAKQSPGGRSSSYIMYIKYRHGLEAFLRYCLANFDVVVFTASRNYYASAIVNQLEKQMPDIQFVGPELHSTGTCHNNTITLLSRDHCTPTNAGYVKDLFLLGCDLRRTVLIDNNIVCGAFQPYNFIHIKDFARRPLVEGSKSAESVKHDAEKGMVISAPTSTSTSSGATRHTSLMHAAGDSSSANALVWVDPNDTVLEELIAPGGLLEYLASCDDIPEGLRCVLAESISKQERDEKTLSS